MSGYTCGHDYLPPLPFESTVSSLWRFAWRNVLTPAMLLPLISSKKTYSLSPYGPGEDWFCASKVHSVTGWTLYGPEEAAFFEGKHEGALWRHESLRFCPICLGDMYHSYWHQSAFLNACPLHHVELRSACQCCGERTATYLLSRQLLSAPYLCYRCRGPLSGVAPRLENRKLMQERSADIQASFVGLDSWNQRGRPLRSRISAMLLRGTQRVTDPRMQRLAQTVLQARCGRLPIMKDVKLPFEGMVWQRAATSPMLAHLADHLHPEHYHAYVQRAYRRTVQFLERRIGEAFPFTLEDYRRHLRFQFGVDRQLATGRFEPHLLALAVMRRGLEADFHYLTVDHGTYYLRGLLRESPYSRMTRTYWRAALLCVYAGAFYRVTLGRGGAVSADILGLVGFADVFTNVETRLVRGTDGKEGGRFEFGEAIWPKVPGLTLVRWSDQHAGAVRPP